MTTPDWLVQRGGAVKLGSDGKIWYVLLNRQPQYRVAAVPVDGKFGAVVQQTNNGQRIEGAGIYASAEEALQGGLNDLRKSLGWGST